MKNMVELNDTELDMVNGGFDFGKTFNRLKNAVGDTINYIDKKANEVVENIRYATDYITKKIIPSVDPNQKIPMIPMTLPK